MSSTALRSRIEDLVYLEASLLDDKKWQDWLALYAEDAVFWMPAWTSEYEVTGEPELGLNLLYLKGRASLEDRVFRIETGDSFASVPMARTTHVVGGVVVKGAAGGRFEARASWIVHSYGMHGGITRSGSYDYSLREEAGALKIVQKKIIMIDDKLVGPVDIFHI